MRLSLLARASSLTNLTWCRCTAVNYYPQELNHAPVDGNQNRTQPILGMIIGALVISCAFVGARMYTRLYITKSARWDDWTIIAALVSLFIHSLLNAVQWKTLIASGVDRRFGYIQLGTVIGSGLDFVEVHEGSGRHEYYLTNDQFRVYTKYNYGEWIQTFATLMFTKVSICLLLLRISPSRRIIVPIKSIIWFLIVTNVVLTLLWIMQCIPVDAAWDPVRRRSAKCMTKGEIERIIMAQASESFLGRRFCSSLSFGKSFPLFQISSLRHFRSSYCTK